jgi:hypothetical protein
MGCGLRSFPDVKAIGNRLTEISGKDGVKPANSSARTSRTGARHNPAMPRLHALAPAPASPAPTEAARPRGVPADPQKFAVDVRDSAIDGQGAFASEAIPPQRKIGELRGEPIGVAEARQRARGVARIMIIEVSERRAVDASRSTDPLRYANHSCRPNAVLRIRQGRVEFFSMRAIAPGEEITVHYGTSHHAGRLACRCGAPGCAGRL